MKHIVPNSKFQKFMDYTTKVCTVHEPEKLNIKYDYWFSGLCTGLIFHIIMMVLLT